LAASVTSRSKWGRAGLVIATATAVHPGFNGTVTLELINLGEIPLVLYPGLRVAQLVFTKCDGGEPYSGQFSGQTDPNFETIHGDGSEIVSFWVGEEE
jgi:dCTP deaminase